MQKILTVIVPVYNDENNIERCLDSIINQTYKNIDIIVVNDASTDNTMKKLQNYNKKHHITIIDMESNSGAGACRNIGILKSQTPFVTFIDSDDWIDISTYSNCFKEINDNPDVITYGLIYDYVLYNKQERKYIYKNTCRLSGDFALKAYAHTIPNEIRITPIVNNKIYRKQFLLENNIMFQENLRYQEDDVFTFEVLANANSVVFVSGCNYHYCQRSDSLIHNVSETSVRSFVLAYTTLHDILVQKNTFKDFKREYYLKFKGSFLGVIKRIIDLETDISQRNKLIILLITLIMENYDVNEILNTFDFSELRSII